MSRFDIDSLVREHLVDVQTYKSVDPPEVLAERVGIPKDKVIKLNGNENPYGPSPRAAEAVANTPLHIYPDPLQRKIRQALGNYTGMDPECIIAGAGSDELIDLLFRLFISPGDNILDCDPTFAMYAFCARVADAEIKMAPRDELFEIDIDAVNEAIDDRTKVIFVSSPNNPTGNMASEAQVRALLETGRVIVVDEAYFEFCDETAAGLVPEYETLVVLRSMSKWAGLAGLRVGYGVMSPKVVGHIMDIKSPYNVNVAAEAALVASLEDAPALMENVGNIVDERERMIALLKEVPGVSPWPSSGNFVLCQVPPGRAEEIYEGLAGRGVFVRRFDSPRLEDCFRVAVGTSDQTDAFLAALRQVV